MRIDLSGLTTTDRQQQQRLSTLTGELPGVRQQFTGPFGGLARISPDGGERFDIVGRGIERIVVEPKAARIDLKIPAPLPFNGVKNLDIYIVYDGAKWTAGLMTMGWLQGNDKIESDLGSWLVSTRTLKPPLIKMKSISRGFPLDEWGLAETEMHWSRENQHWLQSAIHFDAQGRAVFVLVPESETASKLAPAAPGLHLIALEEKPLGSQTSAIRCAPLALTYPLHPTAATPVWRGIVNWAMVHPASDWDHDQRLDIDSLVQLLWNTPALRALLGARVENAAQPIVPLPLLKIAEPLPESSRSRQAPLLFIDAPRDDIADQPGKPRLRHVFLSAAPGTKIGVMAEFHLHERATSETRLDPDIPTLTFTGNIDKTLPHVFTDSGDAGDDTREHLRAALDAAMQTFENGAKEDLLLSWSAIGKVTFGKAGTWIVWGSLQFQVPDTEVQYLQCLVRGTWTANECDAYPEVILDLFGCQVKTSSNADAADRDLFAAFGVQSGLEDELQRESDVLRFARREQQPSRTCDIRIRHRTDRGRVAVSRVEVRATDSSRFGDESVVLQLRPFSVAIVQPADIEATAGELIAMWSSNDPEGVQWRVPDATAQIILPPQAVGEAMERGARFWKPTQTEQTWIDPKKPIAYRFSPPTQVTVRPSLRERRYNKSPANFSALLADAKVESFTTETMYPIQAKFQVSALGLPDIRIRETGTMLGRPSENLPPAIDVDDEINSKAIDRWLRAVFAAQVAAYALKLRGAKLTPATSALDPIVAKVEETRGRQVAAKASFAARLAQYHVYDPWAADGRLGLSEGLSFRLRDTRYGARPLLNPLPHWKIDNQVQQPIDNDDLLLEQKKSIHVDDAAPGPQFLRSDRAWADDRDPDGAFIGGVVHTMEFPSELVAVLRNPVATRGKIDSLAFTALGANAQMAVAFDEGRTIFVGETSYGQLHRLIKIRIGRVAVMWNRARHVIVYERSTVPSEQFKAEQELGGVQSRGWPILRKTEEYVEPLEAVRAFADEAQVKDNRAGFIRASEFITPRVYVNSAWGMDLGHGYEVPMWHEEDRSGFYPKPKLAVQAHAGGTEVVRCLLDEPQHVYFYSNTEPDKGDDTDAWPSYRGVDQPLAVPRLKVVTTAPGNAADRQNIVIDAKQLPAPRLGGLRRPRFDLRVVCEGKVNLQHARGDTEMLGVMDIVTVMRTVAAGADAEVFEGVEQSLQQQQWRTNLEDIKKDSNLAGEVAAAQAFRAKAEVFVEQACERLASGADCVAIKGQIEEQLRALFSKTREDLNGTMARLPAVPEPTGLLKRAVDEMERELLGVERSLRAPFDKMLADLAALRGSAQEDMAEAHRMAVAQVDSGAQIAKTVIGNEDAAVKRWKDRLDGTAADLQGTVLTLLAEAKAKLAELGKAADLTAAELQLQLPTVLNVCSDAIARLRALEHHKLYGKVLGRCADAIGSIRATLAGGVVDAFWTSSQAALKKAAGGLYNLLDTGSKVATDAAAQAKAISDGLEQLTQGVSGKLDALVTHLRTAADADLAAALQQVTDEIEKIHANAGTAVGSERDDVIRKWRTDFVTPQMAALRAKAQGIEAAFVTELDPMLDYAKLAAKLLQDLTSGADNWLVKLEDTFLAEIAAFPCAKFDELRAKIHDQLHAVEEQVRDRITGLATSLIDESTQARFRQLEGSIRDAVQDAQSISDEVAKGMKLVKALGELPQLPTLTFNADRAEYVFDDLRQQIETSPFAAKLREIDGGLKELGLVIPTHQLLDQIVPDSLKDIDFGKVFRNLGALDFTDFFKRFRLPEIRKDQLQVTHGLDKRTRTAWVSTKVDVQFDEEKSLFELAGVAVTLAKMDMKATSNMSIGLDGEQSSKTDAKLKADWGLAFAGARLATFRDVLVHYDGSSFDFSIEPKKVELHPTLKFVDEFAKRFQPKLPPAVELVKDPRGIPVGVKAQMRTEILLPPLGIVEIGPLLICAGLSMRLTPLGKFQVDTNISVGSRDAPVWVQVSYLGGGMWLEARANYDDGVHYEASVGLALGCIKAFNLAGVARGSFAFLLFAYATMSDKEGGSLRAGLQVTGNARIVGIANASVLLLLEAVHGGGKTEGHGALDVSIDICWCYTLHVRKDVNHQIN